MTVERLIGYSGFLLIIVHLLPFTKTFVVVVTIVIGFGLILSATYLRWKSKINRYIHSHHGMMSLPHFFNRLEAEGQRIRLEKKHKLRRE